jgi:hypothetical protein
MGKYLIFSLAIVLIVSLLSGCGKMQSREPAAAEAAVPGTPAAPIGPDVPAVAVTSSPALVADEPPLPPTPKPAPTAMPLILLPADEVKKVTQGWSPFRDPTLGISFAYPPDYEVRVQGDREWLTLSIDRPVKGPDGGEMREAFLSIFVWNQVSRIEGPDSLVEWEATLPPEMDPVGGKIVIVEETLLPQLGKAWVIQWEPLPGNPEVVVQSVAVPKEERMIWVNLGDLTYPDRRRESSLWPQQMAFLATLEVTR